MKSGGAVAGRHPSSRRPYYSKQIIILLHGQARHIETMAQRVAAGTVTDGPALWIDMILLVVTRCPVFAIERLFVPRCSV